MKLNRENSWVLAVFDFWTGIMKWEHFFWIRNWSVQLGGEFLVFPRWQTRAQINGDASSLHQTFTSYRRELCSRISELGCVQVPWSKERERKYLYNVAVNCSSAGWSPEVNAGGRDGSSVERVRKQTDCDRTFRTSGLSLESLWIINILRTLVLFDETSSRRRAISSSWSKRRKKREKYGKRQLFER